LELIIGLPKDGKGNFARRMHQRPQQKKCSVKGGVGREGSKCASHYI